MENELQAILENEYGISVFHEDLLEEDLQKRGYRKATEAEAERFNTIFQYAPQIAKDIYYSEAVQKSFKSAVNGSYRVKLEPGLHLGKSHTIKGAFKGNAYDENGILRTHADWLVNNVELDVSMAPQLAMSVFNATSFVTGQYFMAEINRNLSDIKIDTKEIKEFLENDKESEIKAKIDSLNEILRHLPFMNDNPDRISQTHQELSSIQTTALKYIHFSQRTISAVKQKAGDDDKGDTIKNRLKEAIDALVQYRLLVAVYCQSKLIEIYLNRIQDIEELTLYRDELKNIVNDYNDIYFSTLDWMQSYLNENHSLNDAGALQIMTTFTITVAPILFGGWRSIRPGFKTASAFNNWMNDKRQKNKNEHVNYVQELMNSFSYDEGSIKGPVRNITRYIEATRRKIEIIKVGDSIYTNLPA